jgi:hypothetical protein
MDDAAQYLGNYPLKCEREERIQFWIENSGDWIPANSETNNQPLCQDCPLREDCTDRVYQYAPLAGCAKREAGEQ